MTRKEAERLGLPLVYLLTFDLELARPRRLKEGEIPMNLLYSLDELEVGTKVLKRDPMLAVPPDTVTCETSGLPLRPLHIDLLDTGSILRAVPISWNEGVDYYKWKAAVEGAD